MSVRPYILFVGFIIILIITTILLCESALCMTTGQRTPQVNHSMWVAGRVVFEICWGKWWRIIDNMYCARCFSNPSIHPSSHRQSYRSKRNKERGWGEKGLRRWSGGVWDDITFFIVIINVYQKEVDTLSPSLKGPTSFLSSLRRVLLPWTLLLYYIPHHGVSFYTPALVVFIVRMVVYLTINEKDDECGKQDDNVFWISRVQL